jgi:putative transposase
VRSRKRKKYTITSWEVHDRAASTIQTHVGLADHGHKCTASVIISILLYAAARITSVFDACGRLLAAPSDQAMRNALRATLPPINELERRLNAGLAADLPKALRKRRYPVAIDLTLIPYHGEPYRSPVEVYRGEPKSGTSHFHAYATAYVVRAGRRFTVAMTQVLYGEPIKDVVQRLLQQASRIGAKPRFLLMDRGFYSVEVVRYLQAARYPFLMPVARRGRKPRDPEKSQSVWRFFTWKRDGWSEHRWRDAKGRLATVGICVVYGRFGRRGQRRRLQALVYAYWGFRPRSCDWVRETYRTRFAIETTYRQMNQARIRTCTRDPLLRLLFVGLALILRNVWVWLHLMCLAETSRRRVELHLERLRFRRLLLWLQHYAEKLFGFRDFIVTERPMPP